MDILDPYVKKFLKIQIIVAFAAVILGFVAFSAVSALVNSVTQSTSSNYDPSNIAWGAGLAMGLSALGAGIGLSSVGSAAISAVSEKRDTLGVSLIFVALVEGIGIIGFVIAFLLLQKIP